MAMEAEAMHGHYQVENVALSGLSTGGLEAPSTHAHACTPGEGQSLCLLSHTVTDGLLIMWTKRPAALTLGVGTVY